VDSISIRKILKRYLEGKTSGQEKDSVNRWYHSFEDTPISQQHDDDARREVWSRIETAIRKPDRLTLKVTWLRAAAAVLIVITAGASAWLAFRDTGAKAITFSEFRTTTGERRSIVLADGSHLMLNSSTHLRVSEDFSKTRYVELTDGEVFFEVAHDRRRPFIVQSGSLTTRVLGTAFNICAYRQSRDLRVSVVSGRVSVSEGSALLNTLTKDQCLVFNNADSTFSVAGVRQSMFSWREGIIALEDVSFAEMAQRVHRHYGVIVKTSDPQIRNTRYTATLRAEMKPKEAVDVLAAIHGFNVQLKQDTIILHP
jgi:transmembrane sensor